MRRRLQPTDMALSDETTEELLSACRTTIGDEEGVYVTTGDLTMDRFGELVEAIQSILREH